MKTMKKLLRKDLSAILGSGGDGCHRGGDSYEMYEDETPGQCIAEAEAFLLLFVKEQPY